jgi:SAM-dependent methyltransferase
LDVIANVLPRAFIPTSFKYRRELAYWDYQWKKEGRAFENSWYKQLMLAIAEEDDEDFISGKVIADFGCGPRGSLCWATGAERRIGIDVLANVYRRFGTDAHNMEYLESSENEIALPADSVDIMFTLNAMDHVDDFDAMCQEILRVLKPGGTFVGSFNLEEPATFAEPQCLTEQNVNDALLRHLKIESYRVASQGPGEDTYHHFFDNSEPPTSGERYLWVRARKPG